MSNHQPDPDALNQSAIDVMTHVSNVMSEGLVNTLIEAGIELWLAAFPSAQNFLPSPQQADQINIKEIKRRSTSLLDVLTHLSDKTPEA